MIVEFGAFAMILALVLSVAQVGLSAVGRLRRSALLAGAGEGAALAGFGVLTLSFAALIYAFVISDFSVANVAANSHSEKPALYRVSAAWGSHEGSMLLWNIALTGFGAVLAWRGRALPRDLKASALAVQGLIGTVFLAYTALASNPFVRLADPPVEGRSLNPLLQDPALAVHPPFLYAGYVGMSVVFSLGVAALIEGRIDAAWARWVRPWALAAWSFLTVGIALGSYWAYYELGWGGWWFWDPVENASFMPWLVGAALLHSAVVTEKRGALPGWTVFLAIAAFSFSMLGAFLVRSGVLTSVHAFAVDPTRGVLLLALLLVFSGSAFALFAWRAPSLTPGGVFAPISRESALVTNNILLSAATLTVLLGTLFPLIREAVTGEAISVGPPYFNLTFTPLMALLCVVVPFGPLLAWKRGDLSPAVRALLPALVLGVATGLAALWLLTPRKAFAVWLIVGALTEAAQRIRLFKAPLAESFRRLRGLPRGAWGATLAHAGLGIFVLGACFETAWKMEAAQTLAPGQSLRLGAWELVLKDVRRLDGPNYEAVTARITALRDGREVCALSPSRRFYPAGGQTTSEVAICSVDVSHLYLVLGERREGPGGKPVWLVRGYWNPLAVLIFAGPAVMALGGLISLTDRRLRLAPGRRREAQT
jgi:cytochrome c-type biogenesis protein CcmF